MTMTMATLPSLCLCLFFLVLLLVPSPECARVAASKLLLQLQGRRVEPRVMAEVVHQTSQWCVAAQGISDSTLQAALDWACGTGSTEGNADCTGIQTGGSCFNPDTLKDHASYAFNQYYQKQSQDPLACNFGSSAIITYVDPSVATCTYPSTSSGLSSPTSSSSSSSSSSLNYTGGSTPSGTSPTTFANNSSHLLCWYNTYPFWSTLVVLFLWSTSR